MKNIQFLPLLLLFSLTNSINGQEYGFEFANEGHDRAVRLSLIHFLDPIVPSVHATYEYRLRYNTYLRHEVGIFFDYGSDNNALKNLNGFRFRTTRRAYRWQSQTQKQRYYWEIAADYRYTLAESEGDFTIRDENGGSFSRRLPYTITKNSLSINYNRGAVYYLGKNWQFDVGIGAGVRANYRKSSEIPVSGSGRAIFNTNGDLFWQYYNGREDLHISASASIAAALGYHF